jgi:ribonuclease P protein component
MSEHGMMTFRREERLRGEALIERLFHREGSRSMAAFPLRMVYMKTASDGAGALPQVLISVPKRCLKHAVDRNRVKRQVREAYRRNRYRLVESLGGDGVRGLLIAFIWLDDKLWSTAEVERKVCNLLQRLSEKTGRG